MSGYKLFTVVWFEDNVRHERAFLSRYEAERFWQTIDGARIEEDWFEPNISY